MSTTKKQNGTNDELDELLFDDLDEIFQEVKDKEAFEVMEFEGLPDGDYTAKVESLERTESQRSGLPMVVISFVITEGEYEGVVHKDFLVLGGKDEKQMRQNVNRYATKIKKLGIDTKNLKTTFAQFEKALDLEVRLEIKTTVSRNGNKFTNTSFEVLD